MSPLNGRMSCSCNSPGASGCHIRMVAPLAIWASLRRVYREPVVSRIREVKRLELRETLTVASIQLRGFRR